VQDDDAHSSDSGGGGGGGGGAAAAAAAADPPLLWIAQELVSPLQLQLFELFGPASGPGGLEAPELVLGTVHRLALENVPRVDFLQVGVSVCVLATERLDASAWWWLAVVVVWDRGR
jgi:hypothetical protein